MYMELPKGIETRHGSSKDHVLMLLSNLYGKKQAGRIWNSYLKLRSIGFQPSLIAMSQDIEDQGHPVDYVGVMITKHSNGCIEFTQCALIDAIINDVNISGAYTKPVPAKATQQLHAYKDSPLFDECDFNFNYRSVTAKYSSDPRKEHGEAIVYIVRYLKKTRHLGLKFRPKKSKGFECYCDADFAGNWNKDFAQHNPSTAKSRSGWVIFYARCPIIWASKLQSQVALSTTEAEYIAMSMALRDLIPIMELMTEFQERNFKVICTQPQVYCKVFEDNSGALELA
eukprot:CCRYP_015146-RA/>CCRYP_015146-RA protein AED:0.29 eAED:0.29 QI:0/0/0/1/1/1/3/0/283